MEVCIAMLASHAQGREIMLSHQVGIGERAP
jgi:hypothetical protein